jgi:hypothetical protein
LVEVESVKGSERSRNVVVGCWVEKSWITRWSKAGWPGRKKGGNYERGRNGEKRADGKEKEVDCGGKNQVKKYQSRCFY